MHIDRYGIELVNEARAAAQLPPPDEGADHSGVMAGLAPVSMPSVVALSVPPVWNVFRSWVLAWNATS